MALRAYNLLATGMGGWDWSGLPTVVALLGIDDVDLLVDRLLTIKLHKAPAGAGD